MPGSAEPTLSTPPDMVVGEGDGYVDLPVRLSAPGTNPVTVNYSTPTNNTTADAGTACSSDHDYLSADGTLYVRAGRDDQGRARAADRLPGRRGFHLVQVRPGHAVERDDRQGEHAREHRQQRDSRSSAPKLFVRDATVDEKDGFVLVPVLLGGPRGQISPSNIITVNYTTSDRTAHPPAADYAAVSGTLSFAPGQTVKNVVVPIIDPPARAPPRNFALTSAIRGGRDARRRHGHDRDRLERGGAGRSARDLRPARPRRRRRGTAMSIWSVRMSAPGQNPVDGELHDLERQRDSGTTCNAADYVGISSRRDARTSRRGRRRRSCASSSSTARTSRASSRSGSRSAAATGHGDHRQGEHARQHRQQRLRGLQAAAVRARCRGRREGRNRARAGACSEGRRVRSRTPPRRSPSDYATHDGTAHAVHGDYADDERHAQLRSRPDGQDHGRADRRRRREAVEEVHADLEQREQQRGDRRRHGNDRDRLELGRAGVGAGALWRRRTWSSARATATSICRCGCLRPGSTP